MIDFLALLFLAAGVLMASDLVMMASKAWNKVKLDWRTAAFAAGAGMAASEILSLVTWQVAAGTAPYLGEAGAAWLNVLAASSVASAAAAMIIRSKYKMAFWKAYLSSAAGIIPAFMAYSVLLGIFAGFSGNNM